MRPDGERTMNQAVPQEKQISPRLDSPFSLKSSGQMQRLVWGKGATERPPVKGGRKLLCHEIDWEGGSRWHATLPEF